MRKIKISDEQIEKFVLQFIGKDEEFLINERLTSIENDILHLKGWLRNLKDNTLEKAVIEIGLKNFLDN
ncbi:MAG: hypothetical protein FWC41_07730 [Firmicutes bacterium]|nr:hypothetical protein [Bacillota bacterium]